MDKQYPKSLQNNEDSEAMPSWSALKGKWKKVKESEIRSVMSDSLLPYGL